MAQPMIIQGQQAGSSYEWNFSLALDKFKWDYSYQVPLFGGRNVVGGTVVDFVVYTVPLPTPVYLEAAYWHSGKRKERDKLLLALINSRLRKSYDTPLTLGTEDVGTKEDAERTVLREFGRQG